MVWKCNECGQKNYDKYMKCMQCFSRKNICHKCGAVNCGEHEKEKYDSSEHNRVRQAIKKVMEYFS